MLRSKYWMWLKTDVGPTTRPVTVSRRVLKRISESTQSSSLLAFLHTPSPQCLTALFSKPRIEMSATLVPAQPKTSLTELSLSLQRSPGALVLRQPWVHRRESFPCTNRKIQKPNGTPWGSSPLPRTRSHSRHQTYGPQLRGRWSWMSSRIVSRGVLTTLGITPSTGWEGLACIGGTRLER